MSEFDDDNRAGGDSMEYPHHALPKPGLGWNQAARSVTSIPGKFYQHGVGGKFSEKEGCGCCEVNRPFRIM